MCLMISLIAGLGTGKGSDPPLPHAAMRGDLFGKHSLSPWPQRWAAISACIPPPTISHCRSKAQLFSGSFEQWFVGVFSGFWYPGHCAVAAPNVSCWDW